MRQRVPSVQNRPFHPGLQAGQTPDVLSQTPSQFELQTHMQFLPNVPSSQAVEIDFNFLFIIIVC